VGSLARFDEGVYSQTPLPGSELHLSAAGVSAFVGRIAGAATLDHERVQRGTYNSELTLYCCEAPFHEALTESAM